MRSFLHRSTITERLSEDTWDRSVRKVRDVFHLTRAEGEIVVLLSLGCSPTVISEIRCRSIETIRTQIKMVHKKLGYTRTGMLISEVSRVLKVNKALPEAC